MRYLVSTVTYEGSGKRLDSWEGDYIEAESKADAMRKSVEWEAKLLEENTDAVDICISDDVVYYTENEEVKYIEVSIEEVES